MLLSKASEQVWGLGLQDGGGASLGKAGALAGAGPMGALVTALDWTGG